VRTYTLASASVCGPAIRQGRAGRPIRAVKEEAPLAVDCHSAVFASAGQNGDSGAGRVAIYHFTAKAISMGNGQSAVHRAAYHARTQLFDGRNDKATRDYADRGDLAWSGIFPPKDAPDWTGDRGQLWNRAEKAERQANGQPARTLEIALPNELTREQQTRLLTDFAREQFARRGMVADVCLHSDYDAEGHRRSGADPAEPRNDHAHLLLTMRRLDGDAFKKTKTDAREWNSTEQLETWRAAWAKAGAKALQKAGFDIEAQRFAVGHQTLPEQRQAALDRADAAWADHLDREPDVKQGAVVLQMENRGAKTERGTKRRDVQDRNTERGELKAEAKIIDLELARMERQDRPKAGQGAQPDAAHTAAVRQAERQNAQRVAREKARFGEWANARRAEAQSARIEAEIERGRVHQAERLNLALLLAALTSDRTKQRAMLAVIAWRQKRSGLVWLLYHLFGGAARDAAEVKAIKQNLQGLGRRNSERRQGLNARQAAERAQLGRHHARQDSQLEHRIRMEWDKRERDWQHLGQIPSSMRGGDRARDLKHPGTNNWR
jgi:hypothetical protein